MVSKLKVGMNDPCMCYSGRKYKKCCRPYHAGRDVPDVVSLVRARFSAYILGDTDFILNTTHPEGTSYMADEKRWRARVNAFSLSNQFWNLEIVDSGEDWVHFTSLMRSMGSDYFTAEEKSIFKQKDGKWLYFDSVEVPDEESAVKFDDDEADDIANELNEEDAETEETE